MVLSERESKRGPDTVDKHLSLHLLKQACEWPVFATLPMKGLYGMPWTEMHAHPHPRGSRQSPLLILGWEM